MPKLYVPAKRPKKVTLKVEVTENTLELFNLYIEYIIDRLGGDAEAKASVDPGEIVTRALNPWLYSDELEKWMMSRQPEAEVSKMVRAG